MYVYTIRRYTLPESQFKISLKNNNIRAMDQARIRNTLVPLKSKENQLLSSNQALEFCFVYTVKSS